MKLEMFSVSQCLWHTRNSQKLFSNKQWYALRSKKYKLTDREAIQFYWHSLQFFHYYFIVLSRKTFIPNLC